MPWFVRGDIDGFFGLALDNLIQLLVINALCQFVLGMPPELVMGRILPGAAVSLVVGNVFYTLQARRIARQTGRPVCALPYGINTPSVFVYIFAVMLPAKLAAQAAGHPDPAQVAWQAGLVACLGSGLIEFVGAFFAERVRRSTPRAAMLSTLSGIALTFISLAFLLRTYAHPIVGLVTFGVLLAGYFGRVRFRGHLPAGLIAVLLGTLLAWATGLAPTDQVPVLPSLCLPQLSLDALANPGALLATYLSVIIPMGVFNVVGSLQNIESAEAAGDRFDTRASLAANGVGTLAAAAFGSCFPTTIYIGHPGWKAMGAQSGYSLLNAAAMTALCLSGTLTTVAYAVPIEAGMAIVLYIGVVITAQAFQATPAAHAPASVLGILMGLGGYIAFVAKSGLRAGGHTGALDPPVFDAFRRSDLYLDGALHIEQGFIFSAMILAAATVMVIERRWLAASIWCLAGAALSAVGLMHAYVLTPAGADTAIDLRLDALRPHVWAYVVLAAWFALVPAISQPDDSASHS